MAEKTNDGGTAFPVRGFTVDASGAFCGETVNSTGLTLRDYFAAQAMAAYNANVLTWNEPPSLKARMAYEDADAMLSAREGAESK